MARFGVNYLKEQNVWQLTYAPAKGMLKVVKTYDDEQTANSTRDMLNTFVSQDVDAVVNELQRVTSALNAAQKTTQAPNVNVQRAKQIAQAAMRDVNASQQTKALAGQIDQLLP